MILGNHFETPTPTYKAKYEQKYGRINVEFALFEAFWVIFCPDFCSFFCLVCGGGGRGVTSAFLRFGVQSFSRITPPLGMAWTLSFLGVAFPLTNQSWS